MSEPVAPAARAAAVAIGACAAVFAVAAYALPRRVAATGPWAISPLMVRVFAWWLSAFAVSLPWFAVDRDWGRLRPVAALLVASAALLPLMLLAHREDVRPGSVTAWVVGIGLVLIGLLGASMYRRQRADGGWRAGDAPGQRRPRRRGGRAGGGRGRPRPVGATGRVRGRATTTTS